MKRLILLLLAFVLLCPAVCDAEFEDLSAQLERMARGELTEEEAAFDPAVFDAIPDEYRLCPYLMNASYFASFAIDWISSGVMTEEQAKAFGAYIGLIQKQAKDDCLIFIDEYKGKKYADLLISFSAGVAVCMGPMGYRHGKVTGSRDSEIQVEWEDGTAIWYEYSGTAGNGNLWTVVGYDSYDETEEDPGILFYWPEQDNHLVRGTDPGGVFAGNIICFGNYPLGLDEDNKSPIEWVVVERDGTKVKLLSRYNLAMKRFHEKDAKVSWAKCDLRKWLNNQFMKEAFSAQEQKSLIAIKHEGSSDKVTLISKDEAMAVFPEYSRYIHSSSDYKEMLYAEYTLYAAMMNDDQHDAREMAGTKPGNDRRDDWWTCTVDPKEKDWVYCEDKYEIGMEWTTRKNDRYAGVRPMIQIDLAKAEWYVSSDTEEDTSEYI